jgi:hypothetical protein
VTGNDITASEKIDSEGGGGFNPRIKPNKINGALAPEGRFLQTDPHPVRKAF